MSRLQPETIEGVVFKPRGQEIEVTLAGGATAEVNYPTAQAQIDLQRQLELQEVPFDSQGTGSSILGQIVSFLLPLVLIAALLIFFLRRSQAGTRGAFSFGKSRARRVSPDAPKVLFKDVAGADEAVEELHEIKEFLASPAKFRALGARIPKGVLLAGPPGTGKTLLARAVAGEAGAPFFSISGSDFVEMFVGVGASRVRDLFTQAKATAPAIVFIDEIDAVGRHRGAGLGGGHDEREQTLNQLLVEMDGFEPKDTVIVIAATNRPDVLDPALLRPGRFDRQIVVDRPDRAGRRAILGVHTKGKPLGGRRPRRPRRRHPWLHRRRSREPRQRRRAARRPPRAEGDRDAGARRGHPARDRRPGEADAPALRGGARRHRLPRDGPRAGGPLPAQQRPRAEDLDHRPRQGPRLYALASEGGSGSSRRSRRCSIGWR